VDGIEQVRIERDGRIGPVDFSTSPRYSGIATFAMLPRYTDVEAAEVVVIGAPFDSGTSYRPGARFGPAHIREASRLLRPYNPATQSYPFGDAQVADAGDLVMNPYSVEEACHSLTAGVDALHAVGARVIAIGGDHTISLPMLRSVARHHGPVALIHFDAHLDTMQTIFGSQFNHGTPFSRAYEEGLLDTSAICHVGIRGPLSDEQDLIRDAELGFRLITSDDVYRRGIDPVVDELVKHVGERPVYISIDIDVLDPAFAPGTGTPEAGGMSSREILNIIRGLAPLNLVGADVVEVAPAYDHAAITAIAASHAAYELISLMSSRCALSTTEAK
jgi:agmatinase